MHIIYDKIAPEEPTKAPVIINAVFSKVKPIPAAAQPEYELSIEITTGISAPPIGMISKKPIKKDIANYYIGLIQKLNLNPTIIDVSIFANVNLGFSQGIQSDSSLWALADISSEALDVALIKNNAIEFSRNLSWIKPVIRDIKLDKVIDPAELKVVSTEITKDLINELQQALSSCRNIEDNEHIGHIFLTGSGVLTPLIAHQLQKETEVSTTVLQAPEAIKTHESFSSSIMLTSLGLGLRALDKQKIETNLLPKDLQPKK